MVNSDPSASSGNRSPDAREPAAETETENEHEHAAEHDSTMQRGMKTARRAVTGPNLPALVISLLVTLFAALFVGSYSLAMGNPRPHDVPIGLVSESITAPQLEQDLQSVTGTSFEVTEYSSLDAAKEAVQQQQIYAVVATGATAGTTGLYVSSASGNSVANLIKSDASQLGERFGVTATVTDLNPLNPNDPTGLVLFYVALGAIILGFLGAVQTRVNAASLNLAGELAWDGVRAVLVGLIVTLTTGPILGFENYPFVPVWAVMSTTVFIAGSVYSFFRVVVGGKWALVPTWILFVLISNPSSGGAVAPQLLPAFYEFMGRWVPTGATVRALRDLTYFPDYPHAEPFIVLGVWLVGSTAAFVIARYAKFGSGLIPSP